MLYLFVSCWAPGPNSWNGWRVTSRFKSSTSTTAVRCESVLDSCRWMVIVQRARPFFNFTAAGTMATIATTTPTNRPITLEEDQAIAKPQTCKQNNLRDCVENLEIYECKWVDQCKTNEKNKKFIEGLKTEAEVRFDTGKNHQICAKWKTLWSATVQHWNTWRAQTDIWRILPYFQVFKNTKNSALFSNFRKHHGFAARYWRAHAWVRRAKQRL